ncbi:hypothetical protein D3C71_1378080 [compost metagenome]
MYIIRIVESYTILPAARGIQFRRRKGRLHEIQEKHAGAAADPALCRHNDSLAGGAVRGGVLRQGCRADAGVKVLSESGQLQSEDDGEQLAGHHDQSGRHR